MTRYINDWTTGYIVSQASSEQVLGTSQAADATLLNSMAPCILVGLDNPVIAGLMVTYPTGGTAVASNISQAVHSYLPAVPGGYYSAQIDIDGTSNSITLPNNTTGYLCATYAITPNITGANIYTITGSLVQVPTSTVDFSSLVKLAYFDTITTPGTVILSIKKGQRDPDQPRILNNITNAEGSIFNAGFLNFSSIGGNNYAATPSFIDTNDVNFYNPSNNTFLVERYSLLNIKAYCPVSGPAGLNNITLQMQNPSTTIFYSVANLYLTSTVATTNNIIPTIQGTLFADPTNFPLISSLRIVVSLSPGYSFFSSAPQISFLSIHKINFLAST